MRFRDWIVPVCKVVQWVLPCLLILAIVIMLAIKPGNEKNADTKGTSDAAVSQTGEAAFDEQVGGNATSAEQTGNVDIGDTTAEHTNNGGSFEDNVQFGAIPGVDDGALDDTVPIGSVSDQTDRETNPGSGGVKIRDDRMDPLHPDFDITILTYEAYIMMDADRQRAVVEAFSTPEVFIAWYNAVKARYEAEHPNIELGEDGVIDGKDFG